ncbi:MAG: AAA family ATPase [Elusimicrobia bacterium]|nr:AAA family ATPase [Elusimicrobiota bacterium]
MHKTKPLKQFAELAAPIADNAALFRRIVFTGGPSGGKTSVIEILQRHFGARVAAVPEAATIL